jgi:transposase
VGFRGQDEYVLIFPSCVTLHLKPLSVRFHLATKPAYHPAMMLKILFYSYATGIFSSRKIAKAMRENIAFIYLAAWQQPDFRTISDFRKNNLSELKELFVQIVMLCKHMGIIKLGHVSIDGTKVKANASDAKTYDTKRFEKQIQRLLEQAAAVDHSEDQHCGVDQSGDQLKVKCLLAMQLKTLQENKTVDYASLMPILGTKLSTLVSFTHKCNYAKIYSVNDFCSAKFWLKNWYGYQTHS